MDNHTIIPSLVSARLRHCPTHGQQPANAWGCPECVRELRSQLKAPAQGEVAELVAWLREGGEDAAANGWDHQARQFARAAELLQRLQPISVSEPQPEPPTDEELLQIFDAACLSEGGTTDEIHLRGLRAVLARWGTPN